MKTSRISQRRGREFSATKRSNDARVNRIRRPMRTGSILRAHISSYMVVLPIRSSFAASSIVNRIRSSPYSRSKRSGLSSFVAAFLMPYNWTRSGGRGEICAASGWSDDFAEAGAYERAIHHLHSGRTPGSCGACRASIIPLRAIARQPVEIPLDRGGIEKAEMPCQSRRRFDSDFNVKEGAVRIVLDTGRPIAEVARELGVHAGTLGNWVDKRRAVQASGPGVVSEDERAELVRLRKENPTAPRRRWLAVIVAGPGSQ